MMTYQQAFFVFVYADWFMLTAGLVALCAAIIWAVLAILPMNKGRRRQVFRRSLISFYVFGMYIATQASIFYTMTEQHSTSLPELLSAFPVNLIFSLPFLVMVVGFIASIAYGLRSMLRKSGADRRRSLLKAILAVAVFVVGGAPHTAVILIPYLVAAEDHSNKEGTLLRAGDPLPDFELATVDGAPFNTAELRGRVIVINFFATWCGPCNMELPQLQALWDEFRGNGDFRMLVAGREETDDTLKTFRQERGLTFPMAPDPHGAAYSKFATKYIPRTFLISPQGTIIYEWTGNHEDEIPKLRKLIRKELTKK